VSSKEDEKTLLKKISTLGYKTCIGKAGTMDSKELIAAIETTAKREGIFLSDNYREEHVLYHTSLNALKGLCRGEIGIGNFLRTVGVKFAILRGPLDTERNDEALGEWISVGIFGMIGAPIKGFEHEAIGLEINSI
ncbi:MAG: transcriptional regulator, partial [Candidatus Bathyarchaeota archaeon]|nr:transcriptional regulator [Candidatus Bathyarchaeota archaeon]